MRRGAGMSVSRSPKSWNASRRSSGESRRCLNWMTIPRALRTPGRRRSSMPLSDPATRPDLVCLSHLRWDFVYQRPQHLMSRFARDRRVFFVEEPVWEDTKPRLEVGERKGGVKVAVPHLPHGLSPEQADAAQAGLLRGLLEEHE